MQSGVLCVRAHVHDSPRQLVFSQTTAWKMGWFQDLAARSGFLTRCLLGPKSLCARLTPRFRAPGLTFVNTLVSVVIARRHYPALTKAASLVYSCVTFASEPKSPTHLLLWWCLGEKQRVPPNIIVFIRGGSTFSGDGADIKIKSVKDIDVLHLNMWSPKQLHQSGGGKRKHLVLISFYLRYGKWETTRAKFWKRCTASLAGFAKSCDTWMAVLRAELWCQRLIAHQHSRHLLCLSLHNYTSWSCFLSPPDHLFPAANLLNVPVSASTSSPHWVNLGIDIIFSLSTSLPALCHCSLFQTRSEEWQT